ncbi:MAG: class I SAM-dependent methyltransferase [bacterium]
MPNDSILCRKINTVVNSIKERKFKDALKNYIRFYIFLPIRRFCGFIVDFIYGVDTEGIIELTELGFEKNIGSRQESTPYLHMSKIIRTLTKTPEDVFIDMGSGKGRVMIIAGRYPFKRIIGVDVSSKLNRICEQNIRKMQARLKCKEFVHITTNAINYQIPDDATFIFFFNPFPLEVMDTVMTQIKKSLNRHHRSIKIIWYNPKYDREIERIHSIEKTGSIIWYNFGLYKSKCVFYEIGSH